MTHSVHPIGNLGKLTLERFVTGPVQENTYFLYDQDKNGLIIDPGEDAPRLLERIGHLGLKPSHIILTHAHFDHIGAVDPLRKALNIPVLLHPLDLEIYQNSAASAKKWGFVFEQPQDPDGWLEAGQILEVGMIRLEVRFVPGHAPGHVVFVGQDGEGGDFVISGDTLFRGAIGRTDFAYGSTPRLLGGIRSQILTLPDSTRVFAGHGPETTVGEERSRNPFLRG
jgi:hydroxyacylglutathione hydrolase